MGRAFRVVKRMAHLTVEVAERPSKRGQTAAAARARRTGKAVKPAAQTTEKAE